jgi:hypothetical protein
MTATWLFSPTTSGALGTADGEALRAELQTANRAEVRNVNRSIRIKVNLPALQVIDSLRGNDAADPLLADCGLSIMAYRSWLIDHGLSITGLSIMGRTG